MGWFVSLHENYEDKGFYYVSCQRQGKLQFSISESLTMTQAL